MWDPEVVLLPHFQWFFPSFGCLPPTCILITGQLRNRGELQMLSFRSSAFCPSVLSSPSVICLVYSSCFVHPEYSMLSPQLSCLRGSVWGHPFCAVSYKLSLGKKKKKKRKKGRGDSYKIHLVYFSF